MRGGGSKIGQTSVTYYLNGPLETMAFGIVKCGDDKTNRKEESHTFLAHSDDKVGKMLFIKLILLFSNILKKNDCFVSFLYNHT